MRVKTDTWGSDEGRGESVLDAAIDVCCDAGSVPAVLQDESHAGSEGFGGLVPHGGAWHDFDAAWAPQDHDRAKDVRKAFRRHASSPPIVPREQAEFFPPHSRSRGGPSTASRGHGHVNTTCSRVGDGRRGPRAGIPYAGYTDRRQPGDSDPRLRREVTRGHLARSPSSREPDPSIRGAAQEMDADDGEITSTRKVRAASSARSTRPGSWTPLIGVEARIVAAQVRFEDAASRSAEGGPAHHPARTTRRETGARRMNLRDSSPGSATQEL